MGTLYPQHRYLGPGNPTSNGVPVDSDDFIAQQHDEAYDKATTFEEIQAADDRAIKDFAADAIQNKNFHSVIGAAGLSVKRSIEAIYGPIYPTRGKDIQYMVLLII